MHSSNASLVDSRVLDDIIGSFGASMHAADDLLVQYGAETGRIPVENNEDTLLQGTDANGNWENTA